MSIPFKLSLNVVLLLAVPVCLAAGWLTGYWTMGTALALIALCALALRNPKLPGADRFGWLQRLSSESEKGSRQATGPARATPPRLASAPRRRPRHHSDNPLVNQMLQQGRVAILLRPQIAVSLSRADLESAQEELDEMMAIVPQGPVAVRARCYDQLDEDTASRAERLIKIEGFFLDRYCVTNRQFQQFVDDGGYEQMSLWDEAIWPAVLSFVDSTGQPGPRFWAGGECPPGQEDHPVVGVCWYEASAYARWAGKRLPTDPEWVKVASWPVFAESDRPVQRKFPWGDAMDRRKANIWGSGFGGTVPVYGLPENASVNGVQQLVGNVWEWTSSAFGAWEPQVRKIETSMPMKSIRGGAFDSYFDTQTNCQFQSGEAPLSRKHNIGFRCALGFCDVHLADDTDIRQTDEVPTSGASDAAAQEEVLA